ncbi:MAG: hypothetical protein KGI60_02105 [Patescibacteria group bacterium]|nr:hypothetical protein [Patescibacteria group bacterium]
MEEKLKSVLKNLLQRQRNQASLFLKSLIFGGALAWASAGGFSVAGGTAFAVLAVVMYFSPLAERYPTKGAFAVLLGVAMIAAQFLHETPFWLPMSVVSAALFAAVLGIKEYLFIQRSRIYYVTALGLLYLAYLLFFLSDKSAYFLPKYGAVIIAAYLLFREWLSVISTFQFPKRERVAALVGAFLVAQLLWATALLPIGFLNSATLMLLVTFTIGELLVNYFLQAANRRFLYQLLTVSGILFLIICWTSGWTLP